jgi:alpha-1,2-mannosyltransferase
MVLNPGMKGKTMLRLTARFKICVLAGLAVLAFAAVRSSERRHGFFDATVYYGAVHYWFRTGGMVYQWVKPHTRYGFTYPPFAGLVMAPMAYLSLFTFTVAVTAATVLATVLVMRLLTEPMVRREGWSSWFVLSAAVCLALAFEPVRETIGFGQVNILLLALVVADFAYGVSRGSRWAGAGIGVAAAIKLTPAVFILYLLVARRWRAAAVASGTFAAVTVIAAVVAPGPSRVYWTIALWDTKRVGRLSISLNQSWQGVVARFHLQHGSSGLWLALVLMTLVWWFYRVRRAAAVGDHMGAMALTGVLGCLISPISWIHHMVWIVPAMVRCVDTGLSALSRHRPAWPLYLAVTAYLILSAQVALFHKRSTWPPLELVEVNIYVPFCLAFLALTPIGAAPAPDPRTALALSADRS